MHTTVDTYLNQRTGTFERRAVRYRAALGALRDLGLGDASTVHDIGAGWTELDITLRVDGGWKGRYNPIDRGFDLRHDTETWVPPRPADFTVALDMAASHIRDVSDSELRRLDNREMYFELTQSGPTPVTAEVAITSDAGAWHGTH